MTHSVPNGLSINGPATVTIQPCAIVSLGANATINVNAGASLVAAGTGPRRVHLRSSGRTPRSRGASFAGPATPRSST